MVLILALCTGADTYLNIRLHNAPRMNTATHTLHTVFDKTKDQDANVSKERILAASLACTSPTDVGGGTLLRHTAVLKLGCNTHFVSFRQVSAWICEHGRYLLMKPAGFSNPSLVGPR